MSSTPMETLNRTRLSAFARRAVLVVSLTMVALSAVPAAAVPGASRPRGALDELAGPVRPAAHPKGPFQVCPVGLPRHFIDDFGAPRWAGGFHRHQGIDIMAPLGTPVLAPFGGRVERSTNWAGGLSVRVFGRHGFVYEAHLSRFGAQGRVRVGEVVGYVGNTGDAVGGPTHDHFEWHPGGGAARNPFAGLRAACDIVPPPVTVHLWK